MTLVALISLTLSSTAAAASPGAPDVSGASGSSSTSAIEGDDELRLQVPWTERSGEGVAFAYDNGSWGGGFSQSLRFTIPFGDHFAGGLRGIVVYAGAPTFGDRVDIGGRVELMGRTSVLLNVLRLYGGGGVQIFGAVDGGPANAGVSVGGGGHFGFEFFLGPNMSWIIEVGGQSGVGDGIAGGATIVGGIQFYPF